MAHQAWLGLVAPERHLHDLSKAEFATQRKRVLGTTITKGPEGEAVPGISVWLAPEAAPDIPDVEPSYRQQVLDGIITYGHICPVDFRIDSAGYRRGSRQNSVAHR
jgi:hypothetical protein